MQAIYRVALVVWIGMLAPCAARAQSEAITAEQVRGAIDRAVGFLRSEQRGDGTWPNHPGYAGGLTPLCTLALLHAGYGVDDPTVQKAMAHLRAFVPQATYAASLQTMVFCAAEPKKDGLLILRNVKWLESRQHKEGPMSGMWSVPVHGTPDHTDNSMTHLAMIALYEAEMAGAPVNRQTWQRALDYWQRSQNPDGSWGWGPEHPGTGSMTCAGIAAIIIASGQLSGGEVTVDGDRVDCCGEPTSNPHVDRALRWLEDHFTVSGNPGSKFWHSYYLYSLERACRLTSRRFVGRHDWYREGARLLVNTQLGTGSWPLDVDDEDVSDPCVSCSFDLMFLTKARRPVVLAHLKHAPDEDWNRHRNALFNLVSYVEKAWERQLTYQVVDIASATVEDLLETPVLFINGRDAPRCTDDEKQKLRMYLDRGGFIFAQQCCGTGDFDAGFRQLMKDIFPEGDAVLRPLSLDHPVWRAEEPIEPRHLRELWGIDTGCRTSVIYCPDDLSCSWELARLGREENYSPAVQEQMRAARSIGINVLAYATNREIKYKDPAFAAPPPAKPSGDTDRGALAVANVLHPGGCDAAPAALRNLLRLAAKSLDLPVDGEPGEVRLTDPALFDYPLVFLHGRTSFRLTPAEREWFRAYVDRGGTVFADPICSSREFADAFRREMKAIFPEQPLARVPVDDPLFTSQFGGEMLAKLSRREPPAGEARGRLESVVREEPPTLEGIKTGDRYGVIFSPYDVSCALENHETAGCNGYLRADAAKLALNILLYSLH